MLTATACQDKYPTANIPDKPLTQPLDIIIEPKKVAMASTWAAGIKDDGTLWVWGSGMNIFSPTPTQVEGINDAVAVAGGSGHMLLLRKDGTVWGWGFNYHGVIDPTDEETAIYQPRKIEGLPEIVDIGVGEAGSLFITKTGEVYVLGSLSLGWVNGIKEPLTAPTKVPNLENIIRAESMGGGLIALNNKGELYSTGAAALGSGREVVNIEDNNFHPADKVELPSKVVDFACDGPNVLALLENGEVWTWGLNDISSLGVGHRNSIKFPTKHPFLHQIVNIGKKATVDTQSNLYTWGVHAYGNPKYPSTLRMDKPKLIKKNVPAQLLVTSTFNSALLTPSGEIFTWGWRDEMNGTGLVKEQTASRKDVLTVHQSLFTTY